MSQSPVRDHILRISAQLEELRAQRDALDARIRQLEEAQTRFISSAPVSNPDDRRTSSFTRRVLYLVHDDSNAVDVPTLAGRLDIQDPVDVKRIHNALTTLQRQGMVERVKRGFWRALRDTQCDTCGTQYPSPLGTCPNCNTLPGQRAGGAGD